MKNLKFWIFVSMMMALSVPAFAGDADTRSGGYVSVNGGVSFREAADDELAKAFFKTGYMYGFAVGYRLENVDIPVVKNFRGELEYGRQIHDLEKLYLHPGGTVVPHDEKASGSIEVESIQAAFYYDFTKIIGIKPYIGIGLGVSRSVLSGLTTDTLTRYGGQAYPLYSSTPYAFAISPRIGLTYEITPHVDFFLAGRYHNTPNGVEVHAGSDRAPAGSPAGTAGPESITHPTVNTFSSELGFRYNF